MKLCILLNACWSPTESLIPLANNIKVEPTMGARRGEGISRRSPPPPPWKINATFFSSVNGMYIIFSMWGLFCYFLFLMEDVLSLWWAFFGLTPLATTISTDAHGPTVCQFHYPSNTINLFYCRLPYLIHKQYLTNLVYEAHACI